MRKLKIAFPALFLIVSFASLFSVTSCKKTTTTVVQDSIYHSPWIQLKMAYDAVDTLYFQDFTNSKLTAKVISNGAVLGYLAYPSNGDTVVQSVAELTTFLGVQQIFTAGTIELQAFYDLTYSASSGQGYLYRYVIIPGNVLASTSLKGLSQDQLSKMKFTDIQKALSTQGQGNSLLH